MMQQDRLVQNRIHRAFRRAEEQLLKALTARKGEVKASIHIIKPERCKRSVQKKCKKMTI